MKDSFFVICIVIMALGCVLFIGAICTAACVRLGLIRAEMPGLVPLFVADAMMIGGIAGIAIAVRCEEESDV